MSRGIQRERAVRAWYMERDWLAFRAPASLGVADVIAIRGVRHGLDALLGSKATISQVELVEVKSTAGGPYERFGPKARAKLSLAAEMAGARALLAWWPPRGVLRFIPEQEWPKPRAKGQPPAEAV